ncbi:hypothetical protein [Leifsonia sp. P73]|uniref:hypothetical protein n=1 Tax=Leifsonia sp. P73 TaxID=3423959 RepID=UPI003DA3818D
MSRGIVEAVVIVSSVLSLSGCATAPPTGKAVPSMTATHPTPDESRAATLELFETTRERIGGTDWHIHGEWFGTCTLPDGSAGAEYVRQDGLSSATIDSVAVSNQIAELWESRGYDGVTVERSPTGNGFDVTYPMDSDRVYLKAGVTDFSAVIHMSGGCIPGDADELTHALVD